VPIQCQISMENANINAGSNVEFLCTSNSPQTTSIQWQWYHNSNLITTNNDRYSMTNVTRKDMGMYQCCYITSSSDSNGCCAQTQLYVISKSCLPFFNDS
jgi:hypothetical protein